ncbi:hypothetical protein [Mesorhizobium sp. f-mel]
MISLRAAVFGLPFLGRLDVYFLGFRLCVQHAASAPQARQEQRWQFLELGSARRLQRAVGVRRVHRMSASGAFCETQSEDPQFIIERDIEARDSSPEAASRLGCNSQYLQSRGFLL